MRASRLATINSPPKAYWMFSSTKKHLFYSRGINMSSPPPPFRVIQKLFGHIEGNLKEYLH